MLRSGVMQAFIVGRTTQSTLQRCQQCLLTRQAAMATTTTNRLPQSNTVNDSLRGYICSSRQYLPTRRYKSSTTVVPQEFRIIVTPITERNTFVQFTGVHKLLDRSDIKKVMLRAYSCCAELWEYEDFLQEFDLEDSFETWATLTMLHMWLLAVRINRPGEDLNYNVKTYKENFGELFMEDVENRLKALGREIITLAERDEAKEHFWGLFQHMLLGMDEGMLSDDKCLAGAIWRHVFHVKPKEPEHLASMVEYVRKQIYHLDNTSSEQILGKGCVTFARLKNDSADTAKAIHVWRKMPFDVNDS
ncbi:ubiquinol-cytochrome-c reductase complex assembly factor 1-like [Lingula anatina]|uniref:Ubiquinol-cytochrome-c reductase complex assembly factor 1-like n=1 Tax=Lingula anatina TaxID=7574 RepID=A0A1S3JSW5_LINAN|nr:ubiquinol-cytochrome-c reductase complex assembly factor 1-like [Lingula anatina]|eukprot:XP_013413465.1 ubiquinol-cytochrome-c reductase complex assembly factor 1-like [Lingula anatina]